MTTTNDSAAPGSGSLRATIAAAGSGDTVVVPASSTPYKVSLGEIPITKPLTIQGAGASSTVIEATAPNRVFHITTAVTAAQTVSFLNLSITDGSTTAEPGGGGILADAGALLLNGVSMSGNSVKLSSATGSSDGGGAIYSSGANVTIENSNLSGNSGTLSSPTKGDLGGSAVHTDGTGAITITNSTIDNNTTTLGQSSCCDGGAIYQDGTNTPITISGSHLDGNKFVLTAGKSCCSGGAAVYQDSNADLTITSSTLNHDEADVTDTDCCDGGGAVYSDISSSSTATFSVTKSVLDFDTTKVGSQSCCSGGGAISSFSPLSLTGSSLQSDTAAVTDHSCCDGGGAVLVDASRSAASTITGSELSHNSSTVDIPTGSTGVCCSGGGAVNFDGGDGPFAVMTSDLSDNQSGGTSNDESGGGAVYSYTSGGSSFLNSTVSGNVLTGASATDGGGGLMLDHGVSHLTFSTIAGNRASGVPGGGVFAYQSTVNTKNSIVALNSAPIGSNCSGSDNFTLTSLGHNLEDSPDTCSFTGVGDKVVPAASVRLGPLAYGGGSTMTRELLPGSPAIDAVPLSFCTDQSAPTPLLVTTDQRGVHRPQGSACDMGAYEFGAADLSLSASASPSSLKVGKHSTLRFTIANAGPTTATDTALTVKLPKHLSFVSGGSAQGNCVKSSTGASCSVGAVSPGSPLAVSIVVEPRDRGTFTATGTVSATEPDSTPADNTRSLSLTARAVRPTLRHVSQSRKRWREGSKRAHLTRKRPVGTKFRFTLNERAKVTLSFTQKVHGRRVTRASISFSAHVGRNKITFDGKVSAKHKLAPGRYTVIITAKAGLKKSRPAKLTFTIL